MKRNAQHLADGSCNVGLARTRRTDEQDVALLDVNVPHVDALAESFATQVVVIDGNRDVGRGPLLRDDPLGQVSPDLRGLEERCFLLLRVLLVLLLLREGLVPLIKASVADMRPFLRGGNQSLDFVARPVAERAPGDRGCVAHVGSLYLTPGRVRWLGSFCP